ncbi:unnamed protein product [Schistosoma curassoni]|nr:unnamed protein product [Schistosoma curassoni]
MRTLERRADENASDETCYLRIHKYKEEGDLSLVSNTPLRTHNAPLLSVLLILDYNPLLTLINSSSYYL